ncbi:MAG: serine/threonine protein kinase [Planctomycetales bacterium]|nr:serine/threonine protein kinase [Planctomycetales bacterium]
MSNQRLEQILAQCIAAMEAGEPIDTARLCAQHPECADEILDFLQMHTSLNQWIGPSKELTSEFASPSFLASSSEVAASGTEALRQQRTPLSRTSTWSVAHLTEAELPVTFGKYDLLAEIDRGGMGVVYKARDNSMDRTVALKVIRSGEYATKEEVHRFQAEAKAAASLRHPNILPIFEWGEIHGLVYFTMELVEGCDLAERLRESDFGILDALRIALKIGAAVADAHRAGIIHRDLKPSNVLLDVEGEPYLIDFGLAKQQELAEDLTFSGQILGTPAYMPPEQACGRLKRVEKSADIYSLGAILYAMCTGQAPFTGPTSFDVLLQVLDREPIAPRQLNKNVPRSVERIIERAMAKSPEARYSSADDFCDDLQRFLRGEPIARPKLGWRDLAGNFWRQQPVLFSHVVAIFSVLLIITTAYFTRSAQTLPYIMRLALLCLWIAGSVVLQRISHRDRLRDLAYLSWAAFDCVVYTLLLYFAEPPRGLLLVGYPMMIVASAMFYRARFVFFMTVICMLGFLLLLFSVDDPITEYIEFAFIYLSGLAVIGLCLTAMIRRVRSLSQYYEENL